MSNDKIITAVEAAFRPLACRAYLDDHDEKLKVEIFDEGQPDILEAGASVDLLRDESSPDTFINNCREAVWWPRSNPTRWCSAAPPQ